ncbi:serine/threonine protein kinase [Corallococcus coralloides DSM 2259]|uniref:Serine/threonine protein kinase n=1 Tax=Corallococcus coralloides (strain ATCC 25202 / DSM 2259 / NBRC 100086 / M2) TaxID=1144275 RepID=H8MUQ3_CORCM|nr:serine/threonine-protein kinase [Corallococcus coralloides]AFE09347.1 serine/threonine protein kinase [Corallococcus coralloides DSM 2259]
MAEPSPQQFGKYVLVSKLAAGGMAVTYRARMTGAMGVTKPCVIKQILPHFVDDHDFVEMFIGEARLVAGLTHGNIAQVFDFGEVDGQYFIAMELVHGQPLSKVLRRASRAGIGFLPQPLALHIASKLCEGLDYAHRHVGEDGQPLGLVHRDVSPDNVLISYEGEVKVIDFGIAKATSVVEARTSPGTLKGKYPYFSPEQAQGRQDLDARTDVYAAGVVLYEMLCGRRPFEGEFVTVLPRIITGDCLPPSAVNPGIGEDLETIVAHAMAVDREARYQTAKDLSESTVELLYRDTPRFTPTMLSQLMTYLFAEELAAEGRKVELPPGFKEQLAAWQSPSSEPSQGRARMPSSNGRASNPSSPGVRASNPGVARPSSPGVRASGSAPGLRPSTDGAPRRSATQATAVRRSTTGVRRVTTPGGTRENTGTGRRPLPPELQPEPDTDGGTEPTAMPRALPTLAAPHDTPVETAIATEPRESPEASEPEEKEAPRARTTADDAREKLAAEAAEREQKRAKQVRQLSMAVFGITGVLLVIGLIIHLLSPAEEGELSNEPVVLWITSKPEGAAVVVNGRPVGNTPSRIIGADQRTPHTLVVTKPGYRAWTRRFTPNQAEVHLKAELEVAPGTTQMVSEIPTSTTLDAGAPAPDAGTGAVVAAVTPGDDAGSTALDVDGGLASTDAGTESAGVAAAAGSDADPLANDKDREMRRMDYPTRLLVLRPMYNALPLPEYPTATIDVSPGAAYSVWTEGSAAFAEGDGTASGTLVYYAEGDLPPDSAVGFVSSAPRTIKGAKKLHFFALDETGPEDNRGSIRVHLRQSAYIPPRSVLFEPEKNALNVKPQHQMLLRGLNPKSTYAFTVRDDFAEVRSGSNGRVHTVLCVEKGPKAESVRSSHRLFETGKRYQVSGVQDLRCLFPDLQLADNQGALDFDIVDVTNMSRKERAEALRGAKRNER